MQLGYLPPTYGEGGAGAPLPMAGTCCSALTEANCTLSRYHSHGRY